MEMLQSLKTGDLFLWDEENKELTRIQIAAKPYQIKVQTVRENNIKTKEKRQKTKEKRKSINYSLSTRENKKTQQL